MRQCCEKATEDRSYDIFICTHFVFYISILWGSKTQRNFTSFTNFLKFSKIIPSNSYSCKITCLPTFYSLFLNIVNDNHPFLHFPSFLQHCSLYGGQRLTSSVFINHVSPYFSETHCQKTPGTLLFLPPYYWAIRMATVLSFSRRY